MILNAKKRQIDLDEYNKEKRNKRKKEILEEEKK